MTIALDYGAPTDKCAITVRYGIARGVFRAEGIDLTLRVVYGGPEIAAAYGAGKLKLGEFGAPPCLAAIGRGLPIRIVGSGIRRSLVTWLVGRPGVRSWENLRGGTVGVLTRGSCGEWFVQALAAHHGIGPDEISFVGIGDRYPEQAEMVAAGEVDAVTAVEPAAAQAEALGANIVAPLFDHPALPRVQWCLRVANADFLNREANLVAAVGRGYLAAAELAGVEWEDFLAFAAKTLDVPPEIARRAFTREWSHLDFSGKVDRPGLEAVRAMQQRVDPAFALRNIDSALAA
jgi:ABC-type nitrate/sulfonate/bicarbonate transport system substrate-binding protein